MSQLDMFGAPPAEDPVAPAAVDAALVELAARLPPTLRFGTSSWSFPGWAGLVYRDRHGESALARHGLTAYARHPLLRAVGIDRTFYAPVLARELAAYAAQVPPDFRFVVKAHEAITAPRFANHARYGPLRGQPSPHYLDPHYAADAVVQPFVDGLGARGGALLFQLSPQPAELLAGPGPRSAPRRFAERLYRFLRDLPSGPLYAVELRTAECLTPDYGAALRAAGAVACHGLMPTMPDLATQHAVAGRADAPLVVRWMLHARHDYDSAGAAYAPFDQLHDPDPATRGALAALLAADAARPALVIVNNNAEGSSPRSIAALARAVVDARV